MSETFFSENQGLQVAEQPAASPMQRLATAEAAIVRLDERLQEAEGLVERQAAALKAIGAALAGHQAGLERLKGVDGAIALHRAQLAALASHLGVEFKAISPESGKGRLQ